MLSQKEYLKHDGMKCPYCKKEDCVEAIDALDVDGALGWQNIKCTSCGKTWTDQWALKGWSKNDN